SPREGPTTHDPRADAKRIIFLKALDNGDFTERAELVLVTDGDEQSARTRQLPLPICRGVADSVQIELVGLVDELQHTSISLRRVEVESDGRLDLAQEVLRC